MTTSNSSPHFDPQEGRTEGEQLSLGSVLTHLGRGHWPFVVLLGFSLLAGFLIVRDYGVSTDEDYEAKVGAAALMAYSGSQEYFNFVALAEHGPAYFMLLSASSEALVRLFPQWILPDGRHLTNYLTFLAAALCFYSICLRLMRRTSAIMATAIFLTQPILFGSAFSNHKDIPFMAFFMGVLALGLHAGSPGRSVDGVDRDGRAPGVRLREFVHRLRREWQALTGRKRNALVAGSLIAILLLTDLYVFGVLHRLAESALMAAFGGRAPWPVQDLYHLIATDAYKTPLQLYLARLDRLVSAFRLVLAGLFIIGATTVFSLTLPSLRDLLRGQWSGERYPALIGGAVLLGLTVCTRQIGLFAGALVSLYLLWHGRARAILPLILYWTVAALVTYATWPYLWQDPIGHAIRSFTVIQEFGNFNVLFLGRMLPADNLPWSYFPVLAGLQLTEPAIVLAALGTGVILGRTLRRETHWFEAGLLGLWVGLPVYWLVFRQAPIYNNLRHFYFVLPPILIVAGIGFEALVARARRPWLRGTVVALVLAPGVWGIIWLHPYEYTYFNSLTGGVSGAYEVFDQDYWCTSLKEATEVVNRITDRGDTVQVYGPVSNALPYVKADLGFLRRRSPLSSADALTICMHNVNKPRDPPDFRLVYQVRRGRAVFAEVWARSAVSAAE